jgi:hypothetical protein
VLGWIGPEGGRIGVGFDDGQFGSAQMRTEIDFARQAHPDLPDEVPPGTIFAFGKEGTGHLKARFRVGNTVYRSGGQRDLRRLWETVGLIDGLLHPERHKIAS